VPESIIQIKRSSNTAAPDSLANGEIAYSFQSNSLFIGNPDGPLFKIGGGSDSGKLQHANGVLTNSAALVANATGYLDNILTANITSTDTYTANVINATDITISNTLTVNGSIILRGDSLTLGDGSGDTISFGATVNTSIIPTQNSALTLGSASFQWQDVRANKVTLATDPSANLEAATKQYVDNVSASLIGNSISIGVPADGAYSNGVGSAGEGAIVINTTDKISKAIDNLNEAMYNVYTNNYVRDVTVTCTSGNTGGAPLTATLTLAVTGNATHYDINWGDGTFSNNTTDSTPSHTYTDNTNSPFDLTVTAKNTSAKGAGNTATASVTDLITLYTTDPQAGFAVYNASSGGSTLTEANINQQVFLDNDTTNANGVTATFFVNWGDGSSNSVASTTADGGTEGARLGHTYTSGTGTGSNTIALSINTHSTANPSQIPDTHSATIKIFDTAIAAPNGLSTKTITLTSGSTGQSPKVASGFVDHTSGNTTLSAGDTPIRYTGSGTRSTSGTANSTLFYNGDTGTLIGYVDGSADGSIILASSNNAGGTSGSLTIVSDVDYYNSNASGQSVSTSARTFAPGLYAGLTARMTKSTLSPGAHTFKMHHSTTGNTAQVQFIEDSLTGTPAISMASATVTQNSAGTLAYVSGIPYYTNNAVLNVAGVLVSNVAGQTYRNTTSPIEITNGTNTESDSGSAINSQSKTYVQAYPGATLNSNYPIANTGLGANVTLNTIQVNVSGGGRCVQGLAMYGKNVNGTGASVTLANTQIQAYNGTSSGVNETAIPVADALGATYDDDGKRIKVSWSGATPAFSNSTNYYTSNVWSGAETIAGTDEAVVRFGTLTHYTQNLSTGYLPVGPNLNTSRSGTQYFTYAFRRTTMANFTLTLSGKVSSMYIAAPNTDIDDTSDSNGWLNCSAAYAGAGTPGANTSAGGNGSDGCAFTSGDVIVDNQTYSGSTFTFTLGDQNASSSFGNQVLIRIGLNSGDSITSMSIA
jgi:hypothetical protein